MAQAAADGSALAARIERLQQLAADLGRSPVPVIFHQATAERHAIEDYEAMGIMRCTLRVEPGDQDSVRRQLDALAALVAPFNCAT
jgi:hypothetical protein